MSVNAINAAEPQQQPKRSSMGAAIGTGVALCTIGAGAGCFMAKRPDLAQVFAMPNDKFETVTKGAAEDLKDAINEIKDARTKYANAGAAERTALNTALQEEDRLIKSDAMKPENFDALNTTINDSKGELAKAKKIKVGETEVDKTFAELNKAVYDKRQEWSKAKKELNALAAEADKTAAQAKVDNALKELNEAKATRINFKEEFGKYVKAERDMQKARLDKYTAEAGKDGVAKKAKDAVTKAAKDLESAKNTVLNELKEKPAVTEAYGKIKKLFPKEGQLKNAGIWGGCALAAGLILGAILGGGKKEEA